ncbi:unnamed protein product [Pedinophyceae sp. YPF-701]|nr:unnamed protein product [Pedinophyceae sp. YPF-701]
MSMIFSANQYESAFRHNNNWEVKRQGDKSPSSTMTASGLLAARKGKTEFIADDKGHLLEGKGVRKMSTAFNTELKEFQQSPSRWPTPSPEVPLGPRSTMGYKGRQTDYLPTSTVNIRTVEIPGCRETMFS